MRPLVLALVAGIVGAGVAGLALTAVPMPTSLQGPLPAPLASGTRSYTLDIRPAAIPVGAAATWHAWTFDGQVPGPTIEVLAGQTLRVTVRNQHDIVHSFHTHLADYPLAHDGSQVNAITGIGHRAMIPPGGEHTFEFRPLRAGLYFYHCHSADGGHPISHHIAQGLYGAILVGAPGEPPVRDVAVFMAELGYDVEGAPAPYYIMNGKGLPEGERALERIAAEQGAAGVAAQFGVTVPAIKARAGETVRLNLVNIGDQPHTFHVHAMDLVSVDMYPGRIHPANTVQLLPGAAERVLVTPTHPGVWLFHCHVVSHADRGMIGVLVVEDPGAAGSGPAGGPSPEAGGPGLAGTAPGPSAGPPSEAEAMPEPDTVVEVVAGGGGRELWFEPAEVRVAAGALVRVVLKNEGEAPHTFTIPGRGVDTGPVPPGGVGMVTFLAERAGSFPFVCTVAGHQGAGMEGRLVVG